MKQRCFIKDHFEQGEHAVEIKEKLDIQFGREVYSISTVYRKIALLKCGQTSLEDAPRAGRSIDEQLLKRISDVLEEEPYSSLRYIANILNSNESTIYRYITLYLHKKYVHTRWIPHSLNDAQKKSRVEGAKELLSVLLSCQKENWRNIITGDSSWFSFSYGIDGVWLDEGESPPEQECGGIYTTKILVTIIWGVNGIYLVDFLPEDESFNTSYFIQNILIPIHSQKMNIWSESHRRKIWLHLDNSRVHNSIESMKKTAEFGFKRAPQPAFSPDIAPTDFFLWGDIKEKLKGSKFDDKDQLFEAITEISNKISREIKLNVFQHWIKRCEYVIKNKGNYFNKQ